MGEKRGGTAKKRLERCGTAKNGRSSPFQILEFGEIPFLYRLKPVFAPVPTHFLPRSNPVFTPFFSRSCPFLFLFLSCSCTAWLSHLDARQLQPNHWTTSDHHWSTGPVGGLSSWRGDTRDQFPRYVCSRTWEQAERRHRKARAQATPITKKREDSTHKTICGDGRVRWVAAPPAYGVLPARLGNF